MANKEEIISYVMHTPGNTNPNVLGSMLEGAGGGGSNFIVHAEANLSDITVTVDKTYNEIVETINNNKIPIMIATAYNMTMVGNLYNFYIDEDEGYINFQVISFESPTGDTPQPIVGIRVYSITIRSDDTTKLEIVYKNFE